MPFHREEGSPTLAPEDVFALQHMVAAYGHIVDGREWDRLGELFTEDLVFIFHRDDLEPTHSLAELIERWSAPGDPHPVGHHETNVQIEPQADGTVHVTWKGIAVHYDGRCRSFVYYEHVRRTDDGWRGFWRRVVLRPTAVDPVLAAGAQPASYVVGSSRAEP
jgi:hypothetical protein